MPRAENSPIELTTYIGVLQQREQNLQRNDPEIGTVAEGKSPDLAHDPRLRPFASVMGAAMCEVMIITSQVPEDKIGHPFMAGLATAVVGGAIIRSASQYIRATRQCSTEHNC